MSRPREGTAFEQEMARNYWAAYTLLLNERHRHLTWLPYLLASQSLVLVAFLTVFEPFLGRGATLFYVPLALLIASFLLLLLALPLQRQFHLPWLDPSELLGQSDHSSVPAQWVRDIVGVAYGPWYAQKRGDILLLTDLALSLSAIAIIPIAIAKEGKPDGLEMFLLFSFSLLFSASTLAVLRRLARRLLERKKRTKDEEGRVAEELQALDQLLTPSPPKGTAGEEKHVRAKNREKG